MTTPTMRTADGRWTVEIVRTRGGQSFRVRRPMAVSAPGSWAPIGQLCFTVGEVRELLGEDAFATLTDR